MILENLRKQCYGPGMFITDPGSEFFSSGNPDSGSKRFQDPWSGSASASKNLSILTQKLFLTVFLIHDILVWIRIRIRGSMPLTNGSGFGSWIRILLFPSLTLQMPAKNKFFSTVFSAFYFLKVHLHYFSKIKSQKESQNSRLQGFYYYYCMMIEGSGSGAGSIPLTRGSGSGRPKNTWIRWIRIRIRNSGF